MSDYKSGNSWREDFNEQFKDFLMNFRRILASSNCENLLWSGGWLTSFLLLGMFWCIKLEHYGKTRSTEWSLQRNIVERSFLFEEIEVLNNFVINEREIDVSTFRRYHNNLIFCNGKQDRVTQSCTRSHNSSHLFWLSLKTINTNKLVSLHCKYSIRCSFEVIGK